MTHEQREARERALERGDQQEVDFWDELDKAQDQIAKELFLGWTIEQIETYVSAHPEIAETIYNQAFDIKVPTIELPSSDTAYIITGTLVLAGTIYLVINQAGNIAKIVAPASIGAQTILKDPSKVKLVQELEQAGVKLTPNSIVNITRTMDGRIIWLEKGNATSGLQHIISEHGAQFASKGIAESQIPQFLIKAASDGVVVGYQGTRPIYEVVFNGQLQRVAITIGSNGYIVGAKIRSIP